MLAARDGGAPVEDREGHSSEAESPSFLLVRSDSIGVLLTGKHVFDTGSGNTEFARGIGEDDRVKGVGLAAEQRPLQHAQQLVSEAEGTGEVEHAAHIETVRDHAI